MRMRADLRLTVFRVLVGEGCPLSGPSIPTVPEPRASLFVVTLRSWRIHRLHLPPSICRPGLCMLLLILLLLLLRRSLWSLSASITVPLFPRRILYFVTVQDKAFNHTFYRWQLSTTTANQHICRTDVDQIARSEHWPLSGTGPKRTWPTPKYNITLKILNASIMYS